MRRSTASTLPEEARQKSCRGSMNAAIYVMSRNHVSYISLQAEELKGQGTAAAAAYCTVQ
jgi:hypothetical protein